MLHLQTFWHFMFMHSYISLRASISIYMILHQQAKKKSLFGKIASTISANKQNDVCCCKILWNILQGILQNGPNGPICISHYINRITNVDIFLFFLSETQLVVKVRATWFRILQILFSYYLTIRYDKPRYFLWYQ